MKNHPILKSISLAIFLLLSSVGVSQNLSFEELRQAFDFKDKGNITVLKQNGFVENQAIKTDRQSSYKFINSETRESVDVTYLDGYELEGGYHVIVDYKTESEKTYNGIINSAKSNGFIYSKKNDFYKWKDGTYIGQTIEALGKTDKIFHIKYTHHVGKEVSPIPHTTPEPPPFDFRYTDSLQYVTSMPYTENCNADDIFWNVVKLKEKVITELILKLSDATETEVFVPNFGGKYTVADVAYIALQEIISGIPTFELLDVKFDENGCGYCTYWQHLREDLNHRKAFQKAVKEWYNAHQKDLIWVESDRFLTCDCRGSHPNGGHFIINSNSNEIK